MRTKGVRAINRIPFRYAILAQGRTYLEHVHFARHAGRTFPQSIEEDPVYASFFQSLKLSGYNHRISIEAYTNSFEIKAPEALKMLRKQFD